MSSTIKSPSRGTRSRTRAMQHLTSEQPQPVVATSRSRGKQVKKYIVYEEEEKEQVEGEGAYEGGGEGETYDTEETWEDISSDDNELQSQSQFQFSDDPQISIPTSPSSISINSSVTTPRRRAIQTRKRKSTSRKSSTALISPPPKPKIQPIRQEIITSSTPEDEDEVTDILVDVETKTKTTTKTEPRPEESEDEKKMKMKTPIISITQDDIVHGAVHTVSYTFKYIFDVAKTALGLLRKPLGILLFFWILAGILSFISQTIRAVVSPICWIPIISATPICRIPPPIDFEQIEHMKIKGPNYHKLMEVQTRTFGQLLDETSGGSALSLEIKKAEMATSDLVTLVGISGLPSKDTLTPLLREFIREARKTGRRLQTLYSRVGGSMDNVMAANAYALRTIAKAKSKKSFNGLILWVQGSTDKIVAKSFAEAMDHLSSQIERLILEAEVNLQNLGDLEERLNVLHEVVSRDQKDVSSDNDDLLANLWTILGGNRKEVKGFKEKLRLLKGLGVYRKQARVHVVVALQTLHSLSEDMEELREKVRTPALVGDKLPLEIQMKSIEMGLERLRENRIRARQIEDAATQRILTVDPLDEIDWM